MCSKKTASSEDDCLPDSTNVAPSAATKQVEHVHSDRNVFSPLWCIGTACVPWERAMVGWDFVVFKSAGLWGKFVLWLVTTTLARLLLTLGEHRRYDGRWSGGHVTLIDFTGAVNESTQGNSRKLNCDPLFLPPYRRDAVISFTLKRTNAQSWLFYNVCALIVTPMGYES